MSYYSIAVDGPAGAGKSTIAKAVAKKLGFTYIDTGAMYRAFAFYFMREQLDASDEAAVCSKLDNIDITIRYMNDAQHVFLNGEDVTSLIRTPEVGKVASLVSAYGPVRKKLVKSQQNMALHDNVIMDGRDIASVVLPNAQLKVFLSAGVKVRALRRYDELKAKGETVDPALIEKEIEERDYRDTHRAESPLVCVPEAVVIDTSDMTIEQVTETMICLAEKMMA